MKRIKLLTLVFSFALASLTLVGSSITGNSAYADEPVACPQLECQVGGQSCVCCLYDEEHGGLPCRYGDCGWVGHCS